MQVTAACSGGEAALDAVSAAARSGAPVDILFLDVQMPEMDGFAMLEALYALPLDPMPVVVFRTAHDLYRIRRAAAGVYVTIHTAQDKYLHREILGRLETQFDPRRFVRIHRSHIVNLDFVHELMQDAHGTYAVVLRDAAPLKVSRMYRSRVENESGNSFRRNHHSRRSHRGATTRYSIPLPVTNCWP